MNSDCFGSWCNIVAKKLNSKSAIPSLTLTLALSSLARDLRQAIVSALAPHLQYGVTNPYLPVVVRMRSR